MRAVRAAGAPDRGPISSEEDVLGVVAAVAPYVVPEMLVDAWLRIGSTDWLIDFGQLLTPRAALESWGLAGEAQAMPRPLFPISYGSHTFLFVELTMPDGPAGGALLMSPIAEPLVPYAPSLEWALDFVSPRLESGAIQWDGEFWSGNDDVERDLPAAAAQVLWPPHLLPSIDPSSPLTWPSHWQQANGIDPNWAEPLGASASVQEMLGLGPGEKCRIHVRVVGLAGSAPGCRIDAADGSGEAVVWVPRAADPFDVVRMRAQVELEVQVGEPQVLPDTHPFVAMFDERSYRFRATMARPLS